MSAWTRAVVPSLAVGVTAALWSVRLFCERTSAVSAVCAVNTLLSLSVDTAGLSVGSLLVTVILCVSFTLFVQLAPCT